MKRRDDYGGPALFSYGFRPFFLSATLFALLVIPFWWAVWRGRIGLTGPFSPVDWHVHEMVFGYGAAVVAGFLFTAVPNWTGRLPTRGWPLVALLSLWIAGRFVVAGMAGLGAIPVLLIDQFFLLAVAAMIAREIIVGENWRNLKVLVPVTLLWLANVSFHLEAMTRGSADASRRLGIALLIFLIMLIGGRIVPSFTRNWLVQREARRLPTPFGKFDGISIVAGVLALLLWALAPLHWLTAMAVALAATLHLARLARWQGIHTWRNPLLLILHVAYAMVPAGFFAIALTGIGLAGQAAATHLFGIGAIGGMTTAVIMRATMGHTGRPLSAGRALTTAFGLLVLAAVTRCAGGAIRLGPLDGIDLTAALWMSAFAILALRLGPWLARPKVDRKRPTGLPLSKPS
jgi:uncharacterized protein involved in response to NO